MKVRICTPCAKIYYIFKFLLKLLMKTDGQHFGINMDELRRLTSLAEAMDWKLEPQSLFTARAGTSGGMPTRIPMWRGRYAPSADACVGIIIH